MRPHRVPTPRPLRRCVALTTLCLLAALRLQAQTPQIATPDPYPDTWRVHFSQSANGLPNKAQRNVLWQSQRLTCPNSAPGQRIRITFTKSCKPLVDDYTSEPVYDGVTYCRVCIGELYFWDANGDAIPLGPSNIIAYGTKTNDGSELGLYDGLNSDATGTGNTTYWQTCTDKNNGDYLTQFPYIDFIIPEGVDVSTFSFGYRSRNHNDVPNPGIFYVSNAMERCYESLSIAYTGPTTATMSFTLDTFASSVYYTLDGSTPDPATSPSCTDGTINVTKGDDVRYIVKRADDTYTPTMTYSFHTTTTPQAVAATADYILFAGSDPLYYTVDGSEPTTGSTTATSKIPPPPGTDVLKLFAWYNGTSFRSDIVTITFGTISSQSELAAINGSQGIYRLTQDLTLSGLSTISSFSGLLDGQHHRIDGLSAPLFDNLGGTVCNLTLGRTNITASGGERLGAIANRATGEAHIYNCGLLNDTSSLGGADTVGSLVGVLDGNARVVNCFSFASVSGTHAGGIVGWNRGIYPIRNVITDHYGTTRNVQTAAGLSTMVSNCMFYGNANGTTATSPVYGGNEMINKHIPIYNYYHIDKQTSSITSYGNALTANEQQLTLIEFFRLALNSNRPISAYYICGDNKETSLLDKWVLDKSIAPYPILKPQGYYPSMVNLHHSKTYAENASDITVKNIDFNDLKASADKYCGDTIGVLKVTIRSGIHNGDNPGELAPDRGELTSVVYLPVTDMDTLNHDFNFHKVQLPYYNDLWNDNYQTPDAKGFGRVVTGWKIIDVEGDDSKNTGTFRTSGPLRYNFADRTCWNKDKYSVSHRVFAQGGYYNVPDGVREIVIQAYWGRAVYLGDEYEMVYTQRHTSLALDESKINNDSIADRAPFTLSGHYDNTLRQYTDLNAAIQAFAKDHNASSGATVYDNAIVLVGNYSHIHYHIWFGDSFDDDVPHTLMSIDQDGDDEPDYSLYFNYKTRNPFNPIRLDFVNNPSFGLIKKQGDSKHLHLLGIPHPRGHFEITETANGFFNQSEWTDCTPYELPDSNKCVRTVHGPLILNGGSTNAVNFARRKAWHNCIDYIILGANFHGTIWTPGSHYEAGTTSSYHSPTSILGASFDEFYNTGRNANVNIYSNPDSVWLYACGGRIGTYAGAYNEALKGDVTALLDHIVIDTFYGGGTSEKKYIYGHIYNTITNSIVRYYCGGPKFGNMSNDRQVVNVADNTVFGYYFGAGYGGTALSGNWMVNVGGTLIFPENTIGNFFNPIYSQNNDGTRLGYTNGRGGYRVSYHYDWFSYSGADGTSSCWGMFYNATLSFASVNHVTTTLNNCLITGDFYGGGSLGKVKNNATSTLNKCLIEGNVYGGGYSATVPGVDVFDATGYIVPTYNPYTGIYETIRYPSTKTFQWVYGTPGTDDITETDDGGTLPVKVDFPSLGSVTGNTTLTLFGTEVKGSVFGGGNASFVNGNTTVNILGPSNVHQNVYGGGNSGEVRGNTNVHIGEIKH